MMKNKEKTVYFDMSTNAPCAMPGLTNQHHTSKQAASSPQKIHNEFDKEKPPPPTTTKDKNGRKQPSDNNNGPQPTKRELELRRAILAEPMD